MRSRQTSEAALRLYTATSGGEGLDRPLRFLLGWGDASRGLANTSIFAGGPSMGTRPNVPTAPSSAARFFLWLRVLFRESYRLRVSAYNFFQLLFELF